MISIEEFTPDSERFLRIQNRGQQTETEVLQSVSDILINVRSNGDDALLSYADKFDGVQMSSTELRVTQEEFLAAEKEVSDDFLLAVTQARTNIRRFHEYQKRHGYIHDDGEGVILSKRVLPIASAGVYIPGGTAPLFSSVLMNIIPAQLAGVQRIAVTTPPQADGQVNAHILATLRLLGVDEVYKVGSAWAIAALAYGTATIPAVDKIVGPGNQFVAMAKKMVYGSVGIDSIAGPSEIVIVCDHTANPRYVAADLLSQVEHGSGLESGVVMTTCPEIAQTIQEEVGKQAGQLSRSDTIRNSLENYGGIFIVPTLEAAIEKANLLAPEHLEIQCQDPQPLVDLVTNAGAIFLGNYSSEPVGDYFCGTNHVLPTGGAARFSSSLSVYDFLKDISVIQYSHRRLRKTGHHIASMAHLEGLTAHANAIEQRLTDLQ